MKGNSEDRIKELELLAREILQQRRAPRKRRPIVIEFCGTPKAGKTSCLSALNLFLKRNGFKTRLVTERASVCPVGDKFSPLFNIWTSNSAIAQLADYVAGSWRDLDVIICDRGIFDALCWFEWQLSEDYISDDEYSDLCRYLTMDRFRSLIDIVYIFEVTARVALEREYKNLLTRKLGSVMNERVINSFNRAKVRAVQGHKDTFRKIEAIDTSTLNQNQVGYKVTRQILETLRDLSEENIGYIPKASLDRFSETDVWREADWPERSKIRLQYEKRESVEESCDKIQPIPVVLLYDPDTRRILVAKKRGEGTGIKSPESGKTVAYFGGHIRDDDQFAAGNNADFDKTCQVALVRELYEELGVTLNPNSGGYLYIWLKNNPRSSRHLAVARVFETDLENLRVRLNPDEFIQKTGASDSGRALDVNGILDSEFEDWSRICLKELLGFSQSEEFSFYRLERS